MQVYKIVEYLLIETALEIAAVLALAGLFIFMVVKYRKRLLCEHKWERTDTDGQVQVMNGIRYASDGYTCKLCSKTKRIWKPGTGQPISNS